MAKNKDAKNQKQEVNLSTIITGIIASIVVIVAAYFGIDLSGMIDGAVSTVTPPPTVVQQPTVTPDFQISDQLTLVANLPSDARLLNVSEGFGAERSFWQVYFTNPQVFKAEPEDTCKGGIDEVIVDAINQTQRSLDIAAFEWSNACITRAVIAAHQRGVKVRMVVDDDHTVKDNEDRELIGDVAPFQWIIDAGIPYRDDARSGLMHNKFMIMDGQQVFMGSMNYTPRDTYTNNNNVLRLRAQRAVQAYQQKFDNMFENGGFGPRGSVAKDVQFTQNGVPVRILFSPGDAVADVVVQEINNAQSEIRFMAFSFTLETIGNAMIQRAAAGVDVSGVFETRASLTQYSQLPPMFCAGLDVYQSGNTRRTFHHKVIVIDRTTVLTGSFNFSQNAIRSNDENMVIIRDPALAQQYLAEFDRVQRSAVTPNVTC
jgi:phosphatidylserine/phosphatidylglycerophosphate/cardiolipin synthase-like enzyme